MTDRHERETLQAELRAVLETSEQIRWAGRPDFGAIMTLGVLATLGLLLVVSIFGAVLAGTGECMINGRREPMEKCDAILDYILYGAYAVALLAPIAAYVYWSTTYFAVTNLRVILRSGVIGADFRSVYYDQIRSSFVSVNIIGRLFGVGSILLDTGRVKFHKGVSRIDYDRIVSVPTPYEVYRFVQSELTNRKEGMHSGRADFEQNRESYAEYIKAKERMKQRA